MDRNPNWPYISDYPCTILIIVNSRWGKTNVLLNLIKHQRPDIDKIYLYVKDPVESKFQLLINRGEKLGMYKLKNPKAFIDYSQTIGDVYEIWEDYNPPKKKKVLIVFDDLIVDMEAKTKLNPVVSKMKKTQHITILF